MLRITLGNRYMIEPAVFLHNTGSLPAGRLAMIDPIYRVLMDGIHIFEPVPCDRLFGYNTDSDPYELIDRGLLRESEYDPNVDWRRYGNTMNVLLSRVFRGGSNHFSNRGEHEVYHAQSNGVLVPKASGSLTTVGGSTSSGDVLDSNLSPGLVLARTGYRVPVFNTKMVSQRATSTSRSYYIRGAGNDWKVGYENFPWRCAAIYDGKLAGLWPQNHSFSFWIEYPYTHESWNVNVDDITFVSEPNQLHIRYRLSLLQNNGSFAYLHAHHSYILGYRYAENSRSMPGGNDTWKDANELFYSVTRLEYKIVSISGALTASLRQGATYKSGDTFAASSGSAGRYGSLPYTRVYSSPSLGQREVTIFCEPRRIAEDNFRSWIEKNLRDIRPASALSTADAMSDLQRSPNTDVLQNLVKIKDISSQIPKIMDLVEIVRKLANRDLSSIRDIIDFLTSLRLQYGFQWRPEFELLIEVLPQLPGALLAFSQNAEMLIGRGKYEYDFLDTECYRTCHLVVRTKIVASSDISSALATYLRADSLGILPTPANIWDIIPFSFVVNWFTNMGKRIRQLGQMANMWLLDPIVIVHTYTFTSNYTSAELDAMSCRSLAGAEKPHMKVHIREVSSLVSFPCTGHFDFQRITTSPDWTIVGSLLWQWMT